MDSMRSLTSTTLPGLNPSPLPVPLSEGLGGMASCRCCEATRPAGVEATDPTMQWMQQSQAMNQIVVQLMQMMLQLLTNQSGSLNGGSSPVSGGQSAATGNQGTAAPVQGLEARGGASGTPEAKAGKAGQPAEMRQGKRIGASIAPAFDAMVAAAKKDGVDLKIESGYRTRAEQEVLWNKYGRNPARVARPGTSNHESGNAIDFADTPGAFAWLKKNATRFGFKNYPPEPWHYSTDGH